MWWKCDLQVATPGWKFEGGPGPNATGAERAEFATRWVSAAQSSGMQVVALADHHGCDYLEELRFAAPHDLVVLPGVEVTTGTGADGVHLVFVTDRDAEKSRIERLLEVQCGFGVDHPPFNGDKPASSPRTVTAILDELGPDWIVFAPHALSQNGIASMDTAEGSVRWKALHHDRLMALDVGVSSGPSDNGEAQDEKQGGFNARFRERDLDHFPCLDHLAFIATSDAYSLASIGSRFTWIRMEEPTLEGLRHAFLDHEARVFRSNGTELDQFRDRDPNNVSHAWIESVTLKDLPTLDGSELTVQFDPRFNVIVGGRGSGKSTVVAALRELYSSTDALPDQLRAEAESFNAAVFRHGELRSRHRLALSNDEQQATWSSSEGSTTKKGEELVGTDFSVRVVSQKELFERVAGGDAGTTASQNLLRLVDESLINQGLVVEHESATEAMRSEWVAAVEALASSQAVSAEEPAVRARIEELRDQITAFDGAEVAGLRQRAEAAIRDRRAIQAAVDNFQNVVAAVTRTIGPLSAPSTDDRSVELAEVESVAQRFIAAIQAAATDATTWLGSADSWLATTAASARADQATATLDSALTGLAQKGLDEAAASTLHDRLQKELEALKRIEDAEARVAEESLRVERSWTALITQTVGHDVERESFLAGIAHRSENLKFELKPFADAEAWIPVARECLGLRSDGFIDDVVQLSQWLCDLGCADEERMNRQEQWRDAIVAADFSAISAATGIRAAWWERIAKSEHAARLRLATLLPDSRLSMHFLGNGGSRSKAGDWQEVSHASPGQRSAAMLSFILHHGNEPLILDQPEDDLDSAWVSELIIKELRRSRWTRQLVIVTHNANIPVVGDCENVIVMENTTGSIGVRCVGPIENRLVREQIQNVMEGGVTAFVRRERRYDNELSQYRLAMRGMADRVGSE